MMNLRAIIFDFDGVILDSNDVKTGAFYQMYIQYGESVAKKVVEHHKKNGGISRFEKFKIYHKKFLNIDISQSMLDDLCQKYSEFVVKGVLNSKYVPGSLEFLKSNFKKYNFFISTGTPDSEIIHILEKLNISKYFKDVYGSPSSKDFHVKKILSKYNFQCDEVIFVGDALSDLNAATKNNITFIGRITMNNELLNQKYLIKNFINFDKFLEKI